MNKVSSSIFFEGVKTPEEFSSNFTGFSEDLFEIRETYGPDSIAGFITPDVSNEAAYLFQKFFRTIIGTNNILPLTGPDVPWDPLNFIHRATGIVSFTPPLHMLWENDILLLINSGTNSHDLDLNGLLSKAKSEKKITTILLGVNDIFEDDLIDIHFCVPFEGQMEILRTLLLTIHIHGGTDREIIWHDNKGFQKLLKSLSLYAPDSMAAKWDLPSKLIIDTARFIAQKKSIAILHKRNSYCGHHESQMTSDCLNFILSSGHFANNGSGYYYIPRGTNDLGCLFLGCSPNHLPGLSSISLKSSHDWFTRCWESPVPEKTGLNWDNLITRLESKKIKAIITLGGRLSDYLPKHVNLSKYTETVSLKASASVSFDSTAKYWWPLKPLTNFSHSHVQCDRQIILLSCPSSSSETYGYKDWEVVVNWFGEFISSFNLVSLEKIYEEISLCSPHFLGLNDKKIISKNFQYLLPASPKSPDLWDGDSLLKEIPEIKFEPVPAPLEFKRDCRRLMFYWRKISKSCLENEFSINSSTRAWLNPSTASRFKISSENPVEIISEFGKIDSNVSFSEKIPENSILVWFVNDSDILPLFHASELAIQVLLRQKSE